MRFHERRRWKHRLRIVQPVLVKHDRTWRDLRQDAFDIMPCESKAATMLNIICQNVCPIGVQRAYTFVFRQQGQKSLVQRWIEHSEIGPERNFKLGPCSQKYRPEHQPQHMLWMPLGIGQRQCGSPGAADNDPLVYAEMYAKLFHVGNEMISGVRCPAARRSAQAGAPLIEHHQIGALGEKLPMGILKAATRPTMQKHDRRAADVS